jgi:hypothetical protein
MERDGSIFFANPLDTSRSSTLNIIVHVLMSNLFTLNTLNKQMRAYTEL